MSREARETSAATRAFMAEQLAAIEALLLGLVALEGPVPSEQLDRWGRVFEQIKSEATPFPGRTDLLLLAAIIVAYLGDGL